MRTVGSARHAKCLWFWFVPPAFLSADDGTPHRCRTCARTLREREAQRLSLETAREFQVILKHEGVLLPLDGVDIVAVVGPKQGMPGAYSITSG